MIEEDDLDAALEENPYAIGKVLGAATSGVSDTNGVQAIATIDGITMPGEYELSYEIGDDGAITSAVLNGEAATVSGTRITGAAGTDTAGLVLEVTETASGVHSATVRVKQGLVTQLQTLMDGWTNSETGTIQAMTTTYESNSTKLENEIYYQEKRLYQMEQDLRRKYAQLDSQLSLYTNMQASLTAMLSS